MSCCTEFGGGAVIDLLEIKPVHSLFLCLLFTKHVARFVQLQNQSGINIGFRFISTEYLSIFSPGYLVRLTFDCSYLKLQTESHTTYFGQVWQKLIRQFTSEGNKWCDLIQARLSLRSPSFLSRFANLNLELL